MRESSVHALRVLLVECNFIKPKEKGAITFDCVVVFDMYHFKICFSKALQVEDERFGRSGECSFVVLPNFLLAVTKFLGWEWVLA